ncbi:MAG: hypothetical protein JSS55_17355 [Proteobacteria bacterium]|nr:hypothetical protein [Pseudomonadota bacterium]
MGFSVAFLEALGRWQRGWRQDPIARAPIAAAIERESSNLPDQFRSHSGEPLYRKRHLYRRDDQQELAPLFLSGILDEGSPTSWSSDLSFTQKFDEDFDRVDPNAAAGAIFCHVPNDAEVVLNIPMLWEDAGFIAAAEAYREAGGAEAKALFHFREEREQHEVILRAPLRLDEIYGVTRPGDFQSLAKLLDVKSREEESALFDLLGAAGIDLERPGFLRPDVSQRVVQRVAETMRTRLELRASVLRPFLPDGRRGRLIDAFRLGQSAAKDGAVFGGWRRLPVRDGLMSARWSDGTVAYHRRDGKIWIAKPAIAHRNQ